jgi:hypothetical protein
MISIANGINLISMRRGSERAQAVLEGREELGGKAQGLLSVHQTLFEMDKTEFPEIKIDIPEMSVLGTSVFDAFMERNLLAETALSDLPDDRIANAFQRADMPFEVLGELRSLIDTWTTPLAIRSSGLLEDTTHRPFAGVYLTKMIPNNQPNPDTRFQKIIEAIKFVWASTFFKIAKDYCRATGLNLCNEKMAVVIQEVVGNRYHDRFYPELSGVARSYNYYPVKPAKPADGVVSLALGLGKTIVDAGKCWSYSPTYPLLPPPFESVQEILKETQTGFWVINLGEPPEFNPTRETEYLRLENIMTAERDGTLNHLVSTLDPQTDRLTIGTGIKGPRALTFSPLLALKEIPFNALITRLLEKCESESNCPVEIEFAMTFDPPRFGFLQVRPMVIPSGDLMVSMEDLIKPDTVIASETVLGNGVIESIEDIVYVIPESFDLKLTKQIADELEEHNHALLAAKRPYLLIVFGRLGTLDPWLGIPVTWGQICGARVIVEATQDNVRVELSQGSHYFHNIINLGVMHFSMPFTSPYRINWDWLENQQVMDEKQYTRHVKLAAGLRVKVDGRTGRGIVTQPDSVLPL